MKYILIGITCGMLTNSISQAFWLCILVNLILSSIEKREDSSDDIVETY